jgi:acetyltransferase-like isoleucine patch superfamily enzyme
MLQRVRRRAIAVALDSGPPAMNAPMLVSGLDRAGSVHPSARLTVADPGTDDAERITLGRGVYIGRRVELTAAARGAIRIDDDTSLQDGCIVSGGAAIGAHCLFGRFVFAGSTAHRFRDRPEWLIRDQDAAAFFDADGSPAPPSAPIRIEDDCWIAQSVFLSPGVTVGRGAVIGMNCVVTGDVGPYEIHGGVPNRKVGTRLDFAPPWRLDARDDEAIPYFYRGFCLTQAALKTSRRDGLVLARRHACLVMGGPAGGQSRVRLAGACLAAEGMTLRVQINGMACGERAIGPGAFEFEVPATAHNEPAVGVIPAMLAPFTVIEIDAAEAGDVPRYGIRSAALEAWSNQAK